MTRLLTALAFAALAGEAHAARYACVSQHMVTPFVAGGEMVVLPMASRFTIDTERGLVSGSISGQTALDGVFASFATENQLVLFKGHTRSPFDVSLFISETGVFLFQNGASAISGRCARESV